MSDILTVRISCILLPDVACMRNMARDRSFPWWSICARSSFVGVHFSVIGVFPLFLESFFQNPLPRSMWWCSMRFRIILIDWFIVTGAGVSVFLSDGVIR